MCFGQATAKRGLCGHIFASLTFLVSLEAKANLSLFNTFASLHYRATSSSSMGNEVKNSVWNGPLLSFPLNWLVTFEEQHLSPPKIPSSIRGAGRTLFDKSKITTGNIFLLLCRSLRRSVMYLLRYLMMMMTTMILTGSSRHIHFRTSESVEPGSDSTVEDFNRVLTRCKRNEGVRRGGLHCLILCRSFLLKLVIRSYSVWIVAIFCLTLNETDILTCLLFCVDVRKCLLVTTRTLTKDIRFQGTLLDTLWRIK